MPITQATLIELMQESRAAIQQYHNLSHTLREYFASARNRYASNVELQEVLSAATALIELQPKPSEMATWKNEYHYKGKRQSRNDTLRKRQATLRRMAGVPTQEEALALLHAQNELRTTTANWPIADREDIPQPRATRGKIKFPRDYSDDPPLEFETLEDLPKPSDTNLTATPAFSLDEPDDSY